MDLGQKEQAHIYLTMFYINFHIKIFIKIARKNDKKITANLNEGYHSYKLLLLFVKVLRLPLLR